MLILSRTPYNRCYKIHYRKSEPQSRHKDMRGPLSGRCQILSTQKIFGTSSASAESGRWGLLLVSNVGKWILFLSEGKYLDVSRYFFQPSGRITCPLDHALYRPTRAALRPHLSRRRISPQTVQWTRLCGELIKYRIPDKHPIMEVKARQWLYGRHLMLNKTTPSDESFNSEPRRKNP